MISVLGDLPLVRKYLKGIFPAYKLASLRWPELPEFDYMTFPLPFDHAMGLLSYEDFESAIISKTPEVFLYMLETELRKGHIQFVEVSIKTLSLFEHSSWSDDDGDD